MSALTVVLDIAWSRPSIAAIKAVVVRDSEGLAHHPVGVVRYFSKDDGKDLHPAEVPAYRAADVLLATVYETTAGRATAGYAAGVADAHDAEVQRRQATLGADHVHHFAVDKDVPWSAVEPYFKGVISVLGLARTGSYGSFRIIEGAYGLGIRHLWQTLAWSGGQVSRHATLYQSGGTVLSGDADINHALAPDWGQYPRPTEEDMATPQEIAQAIWDHAETNRASGKPVRMGTVLSWLDFETAKQTAALTAQIGALTATVSALAKAVGSAGGLTAEQITVAAEAGATAALDRLGSALEAPAPTSASTAPSA